MLRGAKRLVLCGWLAGLAAVAFAAPGDSNQQLAARIEAVHRDYQTAYRAVVGRINQQLGLDYDALDRAYQTQYRAYRLKLGLVEQMEDAAARRRAKEQLETFFKNPECVRYAEARAVLENELERDHLLRARSLSAYEEILDGLIAGDPLLRNFFQSPGYADARGLLLKRMVWELEGGASAMTVPLNTYAVFADRARTPYLIKVTPVAFDSLAFLRSILVHELNHVLLEKEPLLAGLPRSASVLDNTPGRPTQEPYSWFFNLRHGGTSTYQRALLHEYYGFTAQLLYDDQAPRDVYYRLTPEVRRHIESLAQWAYSELSPASRQFVRRHPRPPIDAYVQRLSRRLASGGGAP